MRSVRDRGLARTSLGYWRVDPLPSAKELRHFYERRYYSEVKPRMYRTRCPAEMDMLRRLNRWAAEDLIRLRPRRRAAGFIDIGCGPGFLLAEFDRRGMPVAGFDPDPGAVARYNPRVAARVRRGLWQDLDHDVMPRYDWANLSHVLEHVPDPVAALKTVGRLLAPGGILRVSVPNDFSLFQLSAERAGRVRRRYWVCPPDHLVYFSAKSLARTLAHCGFKMLYRHADFPIDAFLLMGRDYTMNTRIGRHCHFERLAFEAALGDRDLRRLYEGFCELGIGRTLTVYARQAPARP